MGNSKERKTIQYLKSVIDDEIWYFEIDGEQTAYRQIVARQEGACRVSGSPDFYLTDQSVEWMEGDILIESAEFEAVWAKAMAPYQEEWNRVRQRYPEGRRVTGAIMFFSIHGIHIALSDGGYAVTAYEPVRSRVDHSYLYPHYLIEGTVQGVDDVNCWLVLGNCTMSGGTDGKETILRF